MIQQIILLVAVAYVLGSVPTGVILGEVVAHEDVRDFGSGNIGTTNVARVLGVRAGAVTLMLDACKGAVAAGLPLWLGIGPHEVALLTGCAAIIGHSYSVFLKLRGGKSVAATAGVLGTYDVRVLLVAMVFFAVILYVTSTVSLGSMGGLTLTTFYCLMTGQGALTIFMAVVTVLIISWHRDNIARLRAGDENMVSCGLMARRNRQ